MQASMEVELGETLKHLMEAMDKLLMLRKPWKCKEESMQDGRW